MAELSAKDRENLDKGSFALLWIHYVPNSSVERAALRRRGRFVRTADARTFDIPGRMTCH